LSAPLFIIEGQAFDGLRNAAARGQIAPRRIVIAFQHIIAARLKNFPSEMTDRGP
jgi:hypothetical protein